MRYDLYIRIYHNSNFHHFRLFFFWILPIWWLKFRRGVLRDEFLFIFWIEHDHIFFPVISWPILLRSRFYPHIFLKILQNRVLPLFNIVVRSYSGWVLMVLKVLSSKSLKSGENFKYLHRTHIFNSSWYILHFLPKTPPVVCYVSMHHLYSFSDSKNDLNLPPLAKRLATTDCIPLHDF